MQAMLIDDEQERFEVERMCELLSECHVDIDPEYQLVGRMGVRDFCQQVEALPRPPDIAIVDYNLDAWHDSNNKKWNGGHVAQFLRTHWQDDIPFYILYVSSALATMTTRYQQLVELLRVPYSGFLEFGTFGSEWETVFKEHVKIACDLARAEKVRSVEVLDPELVTKFFGECVTGRAPSIREIVQKAMRVSNFDSSVLITGQTGTGKELLARAIHNNSKRQNQPFIAVNTGKLSSELAESELFGHEQGAFTGAASQRIGRFEQADGGTIFLDEIGDMNPQIQVKLLRVLQEREIERLGGDCPIKVNVRLIAATNHNLKDKVTEGSFREDLYFRLNVIPIEMPSLRERSSDVIELAEWFLARFAHVLPGPVTATTFSAEAKRLLQAYPWPGNIRELENAIEHAAVFCQGSRVEASHLPEAIRGKNVAPCVNDRRESTWVEVRDNCQRKYLQKMLKKYRTIKATHEKVGMSREHLSKVIKKLGITHNTDLEMDK